MTYGTAFSGIGGWELGVNAAGWKLSGNANLGNAVVPAIPTAINEIENL